MDEPRSEPDRVTTGCAAKYKYELGVRRGSHPAVDPEHTKNTTTELQQYAIRKCRKSSRLVLKNRVCLHIAYLYRQPCRLQLHSTHDLVPLVLGLRDFP